MSFEIFLTVLFVLLLVNFVILDYTVSKMKKDRLNIDVVAAIVAIETAVKKLNEKLRCETQSLSDYKQRLKRLEKRIDILEEDHPDTDIDYGEVDDHGKVVCVWFEGKKYVPEDKRDENTSTFYADNKVVAETTKSDVNSKPVEYIRYDRMYRDIGGHDDVEQLLKRAERLDYVYSTGLISIATYRRMVDELLQEELTHNDS